jgi:hypothetical protein
MNIHTNLRKVVGRDTETGITNCVPNPHIFRLLSVLLERCGLMRSLCCLCVCICISTALARQRFGEHVRVAKNARNNRDMSFLRR